MKRITHSIIGTALAAGLTLAVAAALSAQGKAPARPMPHVTTMSHPANEASPPKAPEHPFRGVATKLGTTPEALETAYQSAKQANPKLTHGQFVAANMLAHNLGSKNPAITTEAILSGLQGGKTIGQTLQGLGLSAKDAEDAEHQARRDAVAAQHAADTATP
jgi:hypothetical protein